MPNFKKILVGIVTLSLMFTISTPFEANATTANSVGQSIATLGSDLSDPQKQQMLKEMHMTDKNDVIYVTNKQISYYLSKYTKENSSSRALSSSKITIREKGQGIAVKTHNVEVSPATYANVAITAGIQDVDIYVTSPTKVSGTAALTGIIMAFEKATGKTIDENKKQTANEEIIRTSEIANIVKDKDKAAQFMGSLKESILKDNPKTIDEIKNVIQEVSQRYNIKPSEELLQQLVTFSQNFSDLGFSWDSISNQLSSLRGDISDILDSEKTKGIINTICNWIGKAFSLIGDLFSSISFK